MRLQIWQINGLSSRYIICEIVRKIKSNKMHIDHIKAIHEHKIKDVDKK